MDGESGRNGHGRQNTAVFRPRLRPSGKGAVRKPAKSGRRKGVLRSHPVPTGSGRRPWTPAAPTKAAAATSRMPRPFFPGAGTSQESARCRKRGTADDKVTGNQPRNGDWNLPVDRICGPAESEPAPSGGMSPRRCHRVDLAGERHGSRTGSGEHDFGKPAAPQRRTRGLQVGQKPGGKERSRRPQPEAGTRSGRSQAASVSPRTCRRRPGLCPRRRTRHRRRNPGRPGARELRGSGSRGNRPRPGRRGRARDRRGGGG